MYSTLKNFEKQSESYQPLVLVVDNDRDNLFFASCVIEFLGMGCVVTDDSEEGLNLVFELLPDIILLDIVMPKINGLEIIHRIKRNKKVSHIPIIVITGLTRAKDIIKIMEAGCDDYLGKPYLIEELESKIYNYLKCHLV